MTDVLDLGPTNSHGTSVRWKWDPAIFSGTTEYDAKKITTRLEELAFLNPGLQLAFQDARRGVGTLGSSCSRMDSPSTSSSSPGSGTP